MSILPNEKWNPLLFMFILKKNNFNYKIIIDIIYLNRKSILHVINITIAFQIGQFLHNILAKDI